MNDQQTYDYGPKNVIVGGNRMKSSEQTSTLAYFSTFNGLVTYRDKNGILDTILAKYDFKDGSQKEEDWLPKLDSPNLKDGTIESSTEIFVLFRNFHSEDCRKLLYKDVLEDLAPKLGHLLISIRATDPDAKKGFNKLLLIDDIFDTDNGAVLFLRLGEKVLCDSSIGEERVPMINRTKLYRLNVESGEVLKYKGNNGDYSLNNKYNWEHYAGI